MNKGTNRLISILLGVALLAGGFFIARYFMTNKPEAKRRRPMSSMIPVIETLKMKTADQIHHVDCLGTVSADKSVDLQPEVNGRIVAVAPSLVEGGQVIKGEVLIEIDDTNYQLALAKAEAALLTAQSNYRIEEGQQDVVRHEIELMDMEDFADYRDLILREPQLKSAAAAVKSAELAVESAQLDLERTKIRAPFNAVILSETADIGDYAQSSKALVELASTDRFFVRASIPLSALNPLPELGRQPYAATLTLADGTTRAAETYKLLPGLTEQGRMARLLLTTDNPYSGNGRPMLIDEYVRVRIAGETVQNALLLPRKYLRDGNIVWTINAENKLRILPVDVLQGYADEVLVRIRERAELEIVTTDLSAAVDGMQLRRIGEKALQKPGIKTPNGKPAGSQPTKEDA